MFKFNFILKLVLIAVLILPLGSCKKPEGPGGKATVKGRVHVSDWDNTTKTVISRGYYPDQRVYIIYGKTNTVGNDVRTGPDGSYEFRYLTPGHYKVYANSLDSTIKFYKGNDTYHSVIKEFDITSPKQTVTLETIYINQ